MIKQRRGDALSLRRKNYGARGWRTRVPLFRRATKAVSFAESRTREIALGIERLGRDFLSGAGQSLDCKAGGSAGANAIRKRARTFTIGKLAGR